MRLKAFSERKLCLLLLCLNGQRQQQQPQQQEAERLVQFVPSRLPWSTCSRLIVQLNRERCSQKQRHCDVKMCLFITNSLFISSICLLTAGEDLRFRQHCRLIIFIYSSFVKATFVGNIFFIWNKWFYISWNDSTEYRSMLWPKNNISDFSQHIWFMIFTMKDKQYLWHLNQHLICTVFPPEPPLLT